MTATPHVLREYALLADGERGALVGPHGDFAWMCFPRWHDDAPFAALIGGGGTYTVTPAGRHVWGGYYEPGSLIWHSRWVTDSAIVECREALALPTSTDRALILRRVAVLEGRARLTVSLSPCAGYGSAPAEDLRRTDDGSWSGRAGSVHFRWLGGADAYPVTGDAGGVLLELALELAEGDEHDFLLALALDEDALVLPAANAAWSATEERWREQVPALDGAAGRRDARHAYAIMSGLTSSDGGMVAAATTSLPERAYEGRSYDYRYAWIRDQCFAGQAAAAASTFPLLDNAVQFVAERLLADGPQLRPMYTVDGRHVPSERELDLPGYPGGGAFVGNNAADQFQLDGFGQALLLLASAARHDRLESDERRAADIAVDAIGQRWREPDAGIWELEPEQWTHSLLSCVAGLRAYSVVGGGERAARLADTIAAEAAAHCVHPSGRWQRSPSDERVDAALLLGAIRGAVPSDHPTTIETLRAVVRELTDDGYAYRYRPDSRPLGEAEGAFLLCGFLLSLAYAQQGDDVAAAQWFERNRAGCGPPGILSEEFDVAQRQLRGNLPQTFVHALLLECAVTLRSQRSGGALVRPPRGEKDERDGDAGEEAGLGELQ
jgi:alpha,alpha-trehalase